MSSATAPDRDPYTRGVWISPGLGEVALGTEGGLARVCGGGDLNHIQTWLSSICCL